MLLIPLRGINEPVRSDREQGSDLAGDTSHFEHGASMMHETFCHGERSNGRISSFFLNLLPRLRRPPLALSTDP